MARSFSKHTRTRNRPCASLAGETRVDQTLAQTRSQILCTPFLKHRGTESTEKEKTACEKRRRVRAWGEKTEGEDEGMDCMELCALCASVFPCPSAFLKKRPIHQLRPMSLQSFSFSGTCSGNR
jgi:hypothetical protein